MKPFVFAAFDEGLDQEEAIDYGASEAGYDPENLPTGVKAMFRQALSGKQGGMKICPGNNNQKNDDLQNQ